MNRAEIWRLLDKWNEAEVRRVIADREADELKCQLSRAIADAYSKMKGEAFVEDQLVKS